MAPIEARGLVKSFRRRTVPAPPTLKERLVAMARGGSGGREESFLALDDVSFSVERGGMLGIIGSNGSGKSTLLRLLAGLYRPDRGSLRTEGKVTSLIELGAGFHPDLTGRENLVINGLLLGLTRRQVRERAGAIVSFAGLERFIDSPIRGYSSGMYMRLGFAIAAHVNPDVLLIDEILAVGDEAFQHRCLSFINDFRGRGGTIVFVSHDLGSVRKHCDRVLWLEGGKVRALGRAAEVIDAYLDRVQEGEAARLMAEHHRMSVEALAGGGKRWGSGEVRLEKVTVTGADGGERYLFRTGEPMSMRLDWAADGRVEDIVFGVAVHRDDGVACYGTNTLIDGVATGPVEGRGSLTLRIEDLCLLEGAYILDVAAHRADGYPYDFHSRAYRVEVRTGTGELGICRLRHRWEANGETDSSPSPRPSPPRSGERG